MDAEKVLSDLRTLPGSYRAQLATAVNAEGSKAAAQFELGEAKRLLDLTVTDATLEAYGEGVIDGKNQAVRDVQLSGYLAKHPAVRGAQSAVAEAEAELQRADEDKAFAEAMAKAAGYELRAAMAAATLIAALLGAEEGEDNE